MNEYQRAYDLADARQEHATIARARAQAIEDQKKHSQAAAKAEHDYRHLKAQAFAGRRAEGEPAGAAEIYANATSAGERRKRDLAQAQAKAADHRIAELEANRAMLRLFAEWSMRLEGLPQPQWTGT